MKIYRIDGNKCFSEPIKGIIYFTTRELTEGYLVKSGFYLEIRKWDHIGLHEPNSKDRLWYNKKLSDDGYCYDNTRYCVIIEIDVNDHLK